MDTRIIENIPQYDVWENVKEAIGDGFQLFTFTPVAEGNIDIRAVKGLIADAE